MRVFLGTLWSSIKQIYAPYMFGWEPRVALHALQRYQASSPPEGEVSWFFSSSVGKLGYILELWQGWPFKPHVFSGRLNRAFQVSFHLKQKTQGPSHIHIPERKRLSCLWKVGLSLRSKTGNQLSSPHDMVCKELSSSCFNEIDVPLDLRWVSQGISGFS